MPTYTNQPPKPDKGPALPIRRTPAYKPLIAISTAEDILGTYTHYYQGRTTPCEAPNCPACNDGIPFRWHAYLTAIDTDTGLHFIFECTAQAAEAFTTYRSAHGTIRGCQFKATRMHAKPNARIIIQTKPADLTERNLPQAPDLCAALAILWQLHKAAVQKTNNHPEKNHPQLNIHTPHEQTDQPPTRLADVLRDCRQTP